MAEVTLDRLGKRYGDSEALADLTLTVEDGELFTIVGPSGCGKSTLLHLLAGLEAPTNGRILFNGRDVTMLSPRERDVGLVFQHYALYPHMTVAGNLAFPLRVAGRKARLNRRVIEAEVHRIAGMLGLASVLEKRPRELSGGQRQRVALGRALIRRPRVLLLDEPLSNLDAQLRASMRAELRRLHDESRTTMIYVTHDQTEAMTLADRVAVLDRGRLQQVGTPRQLYDAPDNLFVAGFIGSPSMNLLDACVEQGRLMAGSIVIQAADTLAGFAAHRQDGKVMLGLRPDQINVRGLDPSDLSREPTTEPTMESDDGEVQGVVRLIEPVGGLTWVTVEVSSDSAPLTIVGRAGGAFAARSGDRVVVSVAGASLHLFDPSTGMRLGA